MKGEADVLTSPVCACDFTSKQFALIKHALFGSECKTVSGELTFDLSSVDSPSA